MIEEISIDGLGVIDRAVLPIGPGFTAITGETGAGKTMIVTALGLLLGARADSGLVRPDSSRAIVEGRWRIDETSAVAERVLDAGGEVDDGELILSRSVSREGRGRATVGGRGAPVGVLTEIGQRLVVVHGQSEQIRLRSATAQREALDRFAGASLARLLDDYQTVFARWQESQGELDVLVAEQEARLDEAQRLRHALAEIRDVEPRAGEDGELAARATRLENLELLRSAASEAHELLSSDSVGEDHDALTMLTSARRELERVGDHDSQLASMVDTIAEASVAVTEAAAQLSGYLAGLDEDSGRELDIVNERRAVLAALVRKHGSTLDDVLFVLDSGGSRLAELDDDDDRIAHLHSEVDAARDGVIEGAARLTEMRSEYAQRLSERVTRELAALAMPNAEIDVLVDDRPDYSQSGKDRVQILLRPHRGAELQTLSRGASGGELSRVMLAIEVVIAGNDPVPTFIFDEIDAGVGGSSAIEIGRRLAQLSRTSQVITVTHLAQVAAFATNHLRVSKNDDGTFTASSVEQLTGDARTSEMARLLSGLPDSDSAVAHARELMQLASTVDS